jgi:hypothetical protein
MEAAMAAAAMSAGRAGNSWILWTFWAAGAGLLLVELNAATAFLQGGLQQNMGNLGWAPAFAIIALKVAQQSAWHWETLGLMLQAVPMAALGLLLVAIGLAANRRIAREHENGGRK